uniref:Uncharacterized protein n=1 Tax=Podoviridae sp. cttxo15 TaxID=2826584 RepID=A0A8S5N2Y7_9CAUD|nr:MAG TPA: hypothetical protein [Podoviridae sp. cttxo15]
MCKNARSITKYSFRDLVRLPLDFCDKNNKRILLNQISPSRRNEPSMVFFSLFEDLI